MPAMPLLAHRRSLLDLLSKPSPGPGRADDAGESPRPHPPSSLLPPPPPLAPRPVSESGMHPSRLSHEVLRDHVPESAPPQEQTARTQRFSLMRFRNFSESHLAARAKEDARKEDAPPLPSASASAPPAPAIVRTAPTMDSMEEEPAGSKQSRIPLRSSPSKATSYGRQEPRRSMDEGAATQPKSSSLRWRRLQGRSTGLEDLQRLSAAHASNNSRPAPAAPPAYGDDDGSELALPVPRFSESSRSDGSNGTSSSDQIYGATTTTHTVSTHTTFFKLPRRNKNRNSLFPLPVKIPPPNNDQERETQDDPATPRASVSGLSISSQQSPDGRTPPLTALQRRHTEAAATSPTTPQTALPFASPSPNAPLAQSASPFAEPGMNMFRNRSQHSPYSSTSSPLQAPMRLGLRDRASTTSSFGGRESVDTPPPLLTGSARDSTSTTGRGSLGGFLNLARFRGGSDAHSPRHGSLGTNSKSNSFAMSRETLVVPEREEGDTPGKYLERLEAAVSRSVIATILSKSSDPFAQAVLRSYTRRFPFFGEPIDMSLRKFLLEAELPKETQQVDRVIQAFADRYHECNPGIFLAPDQAYIIAFSLMMLHTDAFNKNNRRKMTKRDYCKNTSGQQVDEEVLACLYDNICYTPFVHYEEEVDINGERVLPFQPKKSKLKLERSTGENGKEKQKGPVDPYNLLMDQKLDVLRPAIRESITLEDPYQSQASQGALDAQYLQRAFTHTGVLQIISSRSRPSAYEGQLQNGNPNPSETAAGVVDLKITKVGTLWRKATKKKKARSPWQEWGAVLTGSQLYLFKNAHWAKGLVHQFMAHQRHGYPRTPVVFKPPLHEFKPDALIKTDNSVALVDASYNRHKHAFVFVRPGGQEEVLLADNESELNDWLGLINYAAAFRAAGVRIRGMVGGNEEDLRARDVRRMDTSNSTRSVQTANGEVRVQNRGLSPQLQRQVMAARRQIMVQKISEAESEISSANVQLEAMLRNARHLLILAPILPKTREEIIHAAAKADARIKWTRRDIWRLIAHKDILAMDVRQDGVSADELKALPASSGSGARPAVPREQQAPETARKALPRLPSQLSGKSPPQSPTSVTSFARREFEGRPSSTTGYVDTFVDDVFRTQPESAAPPKSAGEWRLPPLELDVPAGKPAKEHRGSVASTLLTAGTASSPRQGSLSHASSVSSVRREAIPTGGVDDSELERLAKELPTPVAVDSTASSRALHQLDGTLSDTATPPSTTKPKGVRRSLHKTLRDSTHHHHHHHAHGTHKHHFRNKDSESSVRSCGEASTALAEESQEGTPGLERAKGRFILHGKQASVVQFGSDWPNERMKLRREAWRQSSVGTPVREQRTPTGDPSRLDHGLTSPPAAPEGPGEEEAAVSGSEVGDSLSTARHWREDAEVAEYYATASPARISSDEGERQAEERNDFDLSSWDPRLGKRETVIGPRRDRPEGLTELAADSAFAKLEGDGQAARREVGATPPRGSDELKNGDDGTVILSQDGEDRGKAGVSGRDREKRRTVLGPSSMVHARSFSQAWEGLEREGAEGYLGDEGLRAAHIEDEELRRLSAGGHGSPRTRTVAVQ